MQLLSERITRGTGAGTYYYLHDGLSSVGALTNGSASIVNSYSYDPYGNAVGTVTEGVANPFRFTGAVWDGQTKLYKMGERYYDPSIGRFTQTDPLGGGYTYAAGNPANLTDPQGLWPWDRLRKAVSDWGYRVLGPILGTKGPIYGVGRGLNSNKYIRLGWSWNNKANPPGTSSVFTAERKRHLSGGHAFTSTSPARILVYPETAHGLKA